jgi:hypothetical protein
VTRKRGERTHPIYIQH